MMVDESEEEATLFALTLLIPKEFLKKEMVKIRGGDIIDNSVDVVDYIAKKFQVSSTVAAIRLKQLEYL